MGEKFGVLQVKTVVTTILNEFEFQSLYKGPDVPEPDYTTMVVGPNNKDCKVRYIRKATKKQ
jgi:sterol 14-demethylase